MKKLIRENIRDIGRSWKFIVICVLILFAVAIIFEGILGGMIIFFGLFWFNLEEEGRKKTNLDTYMVMLPLRGKDIILEKYIRVITYNVIGLLIGMLVIVSMGIFFDDVITFRNFFSSNLEELVGIIVAQMALVTTQVPATIRFGTEYGFLVGFISLIFCGVALLPLYFLLFEPAELSMKIAMALAVIIITPFISFKVSVIFYKENFEYEKKEKNN